MDPLSMLDSVSQIKEDDEISVSLVLTSVPSSARISIKIPKQPATISEKSKEEEFTASKLRLLVSKATQIPLQELKLIFKGRMITGDKSIGNVVLEFKLEDGCVIHCMGKPSLSSESSSSSDEDKSTNLSPTSGSDDTASPPPMTFESAVAALLRQSNPELCRTALTTLDKILENIITNPQEDKYRKVKKENPFFHRKLGSLQGSDDLMMVVGFTTTILEENTPYYILIPSAEAWTRLIQARQALKGLLAASAISPLPPSSFPPSNHPSFPNATNSSPFPTDPRMNDILNNPQQLQAMLQDPMILNMIQNDPRLANSIPPNMRHLLQDPQRLAQIMSNPMFRQQLSHMQQQMQTSNMGPSFGIPAAHPTTTVPSMNSIPLTEMDNDNEITEEEMIQEAIARSLREM